MPNRRNYAAITTSRQFDKISVALPHFFFDHATPARAKIRQIFVPFVIRKSYIAHFKRLFGHFVMRPRFRALQIVGFAVVIVGFVPGVEKFADILIFFRFFFAFDFRFQNAFFRIFVFVSVIAFFVVFFRLWLLGLFGRDCLKKRVNAACRHYRVGDGCRFLR